MSDDSADVTVLFVGAIGGMGGPVKLLASLLSNISGIYRVLIKPESELLDERLRALKAVDEHISVKRSAQRSYLGSLLLAIRIFARAASRKSPIDLIHANGLVEFALSWPAAAILGKPIVAWVGNSEPPALVMRFSRLLRPVSRRTCWNAVSLTAAKAVADSGLAEVSAVKIVPNIIDPKDLVPTPTAPSEAASWKVCIGYLQGARALKGFDLLPVVIEELEEIHDLIRFLIVGRQSDDATWKRLLQFPPGLVEIRPRTLTVGDIYSACDIVFSPSRRESFNRVVAESLSTGTPVVASDLEAVRDVVGDAGLLFPVDDVRAAAECLRQLVHDSNLRRELGAAGKLRSLAWLPGPIVDEFVSQYRGLARLNEYGARGRQPH